MLDKDLLIQDQALKIKIMLDTLVEGFLLFDFEEKIIQCNSSCAHLFGKSQDEILGKNLKELSFKNIREDGGAFLAEDRPAQKAFKTGENVRDVIMGIHNSSQELLWLRVNATPFDLNVEIDNKIVSKRHVLITFSDVTTLKQQKDEIKSMGARLQKLINGVPALISHWDKNLINITSNSLYSKFFGKSPEQIVGTHYKELLGEELFNKSYPYMEQALSGKTVVFNADRNVFNGPVRSFQVTYHPEIDSGKVIGFFTMSIDVTEIRELEKQLELERAKSIQSAKLASLGEMSAGIAHEINNPLSIISGNVLLLEKFKNDPEKYLSKISSIQKSVDRISKIISGLKKFSRINDSSVFKPHVLADLVHESLSLTESKAKRHSVSIEVNIETQLKILCDEVEIEQVIINLVNNGIDAVKELEDRWLKIYLYEKDSKIILKIKDSGKGITPEIEQKMFQPFFTTKIVGEGTGLGLSIVKGILEHHHANISINRDDRFTCFEISFNKIQEVKNDL